MSELIDPSVDAVAEEWRELAGDLKSSFVPITEIKALADQLPPEAFEFIWNECGWDNLISSYPELAELTGRADQTGAPDAT